jgi:hypothetical protein
VGDHPERLFFEQGSSWLWLLAGPVSGLMMMYIQHRSGLGFTIAVPIFFLVVVSGFLALQIKAARVHTSVELTPEALRQGTEVTPIGEITSVYPEPPRSEKSGEPLEPWQSARTLGEVSGIPKGCTAIGLKLTDGRNAQAWARRHAELRAELTRLIETGGELR